jgi:hypothetical protein
MARSSRFVPRDHLVVPTLWPFSESEVEWKLAHDPEDAVNLALAREQHGLAYRIEVLRAEYKNSVQDVALGLGETRGTLTLKLNGHAPTTPKDTVVWSWIVGEKGRYPSPEQLWDSPFPLPKFPFPRGRELP